MDSKKSIEELMAELEAQGITPPEDENKTKIVELNAREEDIIHRMETITGKKYSDEQLKILRHHGNACILACAGSGKALVNNTKVITLEGYKTIQDLMPNKDIVFNELGEKQLVLGVFPQGYKNVYKIKFNTGETVECCGEHLWTVKENGYWHTLNTKEVKHRLKVNSEHRIEIPNCRVYRIDNCKVSTADYFKVLADMLPERNVLLELMEHENNRTFNNILEQYKKYDFKLNYTSEVFREEESHRWENSVTIMFELYKLVEYCYSLTGTINLNIENQDLVNYIKVAFDFFGTPVRLENKVGSTIINFDNFLNTEEVGRRFIVSIEEAELAREMTCIKVSGKSELFMIEGNICTHNTTISTHLIVKRILNGEIADVRKMIYATYSKAGADEMKDRLDKLLKQMGLDKYQISVRTLHSFFLQVLRTFGVNSEIISPEDRTKFVKQACKDANVVVRDDDLMVIDNMLSYQVNNLMSDKSVFESPVNTVDELTLDQYHTIRQSFSKQKSAKGVIDYDDMQSTLYLWLVKYIQSDKPEIQEIGVNVRNYCKAVWTDFYIDEAQDVSKIQFAIIRALVEDPDNKGKLDRGLVFIGDDDQCLDSETIVKTLKEDKKIKDIEVGDKVISIMNDMYCCSTVKEKLEHTINKGRFMVKISTKLGYSLNVTDDHKTMVKIPECLLKNQSITYKDKIYVLRDTDKIININSDEELESYGFRLDLPHGGNGVKVENYYTIINAISAVNGMKVGLYVNGKFFDDEIVSVDVQEVLHPIKVYDINLDRNHNFIANNILTHNCIYQWRGSDPSIILSVGPTFDMPTFVLSTNYRCYNEIVDYATTGIKCNSNRYNKGMNAYERGGDVKILPSSKRDLCSLSILAMNQIKEWLASGDDADSIAVLSRNNFHLAILNNMLLREGIYCNTTNDMKLTKSYMYKDIKDVITIATEPCWKGELTSRILWRLCRYMGAGPSSFIGKFQDSNALELKDALGYLIKNYIDKEIDFDKKVNVNIQEAEKVRNVIYRFSQETVEDLKYVYNCLTCEDKHRALTTLMYCYSQASSFLYKSTDKSRSINGLIKYITNLSLKDGVDKMKDFLRVTEQLEYGRMVINGPKVTLTTIHSAKGREWKNVIMFACDNVSMPNTESIATMSLGGVDNSSIDEYIDEERRLFYVGNTRAKENLLVLTYDEPSYFVMESLGMFEEGNNNENVKKYSSNPEKAESLNKRFNELIKDPSNKYYYDIDKLPVGMEAAITPLESKEETQKAC